ncbi:hypothetical protein QEG73_01340 [Chitinophagaceae bacterium 26-R-25]|nr:hypothetical protein [Chitinophagaceae bacterium 26-R-25]
MINLRRQSNKQTELPDALSLDCNKVFKSHHYNMRPLFLCLMLTIGSVLSFAQIQKKAAYSFAHDRTTFKWKEFSYNQSWNSIHHLCQLQRLDHYDESYMSFFLGDPARMKIYKINNATYKAIDNIQFGDAFIALSGNEASTSNALFFIKKFDSYQDAKLYYVDALKKLTARYGDGNTEHVTKEADNSQSDLPVSRQFLTPANAEYHSKSTPFNEDQKVLAEECPYQFMEDSEWSNFEININFSFFPEENLLLMRIYKPASLEVKSKAIDWLHESNYNEDLTEAFREFDRKASYKDLPLGSTLAYVQSHVKLGPSNDPKTFWVKNYNYRFWYDIEFENCFLQFNKKHQLFCINLETSRFDEEAYNSFISDLSQLFGPPGGTFAKDGDTKGVIYTGKNITIDIMFDDKHVLTVFIMFPKVNDYSPTDKLY